MPAATKQHKPKVSELSDQEFVDSYGGMYVVKCTCGWESSPRSTAERAEREHAAHVAEAEAA